MPELRPKAGLIAAGLSMLTAGCGGVLDPVGPIGAQEKQILFNSTAIMLAIIIPVILATFAFAWWFRAGNKKAKYMPDWDYSGRIELVIWSIPLLTVILLGGIAWIGSHDLDPAKPLPSAAKPLNVEVVSLDWKWLFIYPDLGIATVNQLAVPTGTPVNFRLTSATVWNVFFVPRFGTMIYTMPGMATRLNLQANEDGVYDGQSSHFSGDGFSGMRFKVQALPADQFNAWVSSARRSGQVLDGRTYAQLNRQSSYVAPITYNGVAPGLFDSIVKMTAPPPELPHEGHPSADVSPRTNS
jgi:cytochrome o ubiquinol oxidase subunit 2